MSTRTKKKYHSFFSKRRQSKSPTRNPGGRSNPPKKQHLDFNEKEVTELLKEEDSNISVLPANLVPGQFREAE